MQVGSRLCDCDCACDCVTVNVTVTVTAGWVLTVRCNCDCNCNCRLGLDGEVCALRLVCETTARPLVGAGLLGEIFNLVLR